MVDFPLPSILVEPTEHYRCQRLGLRLEVDPDHSQAWYVPRCALQAARQPKPVAARAQKGPSAPSDFVDSRSKIIPGEAKDVVVFRLTRTYRQPLQVQREATY